jgi:hypothetical protein
VPKRRYGSASARVWYCKIGSGEQDDDGSGSGGGGHKRPRPKLNANAKEHVDFWTTQLFY